MSEKKEVAVKSALTSLAGRLQVDPESLKLTLKATVCRGMKNDKGGYKPLTNEEFISFIVVSNTYRLNPLTKEIYAFPDTKGGGIIPIVSTDGWNKLMTTHPEYKAHSYLFSENIVNIKDAKPCPEWMEIHIEKKDGSKVVVREYLDECFRESKYSSPWKTHTKRMLRHKTKIQGAREAFGFGGIYDKDEGERIIEGQIAEENGLKGKPEITQPKELSKDENPKDDNAYKAMLKQFKIARENIGDKKYYNVLAIYGFNHANEVRGIKMGQEILLEMTEKL